MAITAVCACGKRFSARDEYEGRRAICPACKREFIFQAAGIPIFEEVRSESAVIPISTSGHVGAPAVKAKSNDSSRRLIVGA
jgi:hypothetical protein